jgi:hypothetical protein
VLDGREDHGVLELAQRSFEHGGHERNAHLGAAQHLLLLRLIRGRGPGSERVDPGAAAGGQTDCGEAEVFGEWRVFALGVDDGDPAAVRALTVDSGLAPQQALDERRLAVPRLTENPTVRVGDQPRGVGIERVPAELGAAGEEVEADVGALVSERRLHGERVDARHVSGRPPVVRQPQRRPHVANRWFGARPSGSAAAHARS